MSSITERGARKRTTSGKWPALPALPRELATVPGASEWHADLTTAWRNLQKQLNELEENLRTAIKDATE